MIPKFTHSNIEKSEVEDFVKQHIQKQENAQKIADFVFDHIEQGIEAVSDEIKAFFDDMNSTSLSSITDFYESYKSKINEKIELAITCSLDFTIDEIFDDYSAEEKISNVCSEFQHFIGNKVFDFEFEENPYLYRIEIDDYTFFGSENEYESRDFFEFITEISIVKENFEEYYREYGSRREFGYYDKIEIINTETDECCFEKSLYDDSF